MNDVMLWVEKYRPSKISECILTDDLKTTFQTFVDEGYIPNLLLSGGPGVGKTTVAKAMLEELGATYMMINGSEESGIDVLRNKIKNFASTVSMDGQRKFVILDEADYLNPQSTQPALRGFIEEFSKNCRFILTCNFKNKVIEPLHSRCSNYEFNFTKKIQATLCAQFMDRAGSILVDEGVNYNKDTLAQVIMRHAPDWRRVLNELQRHSISGQLETSVILNDASANYNLLFTALKNKDFKKMRQWVANNADTDPQGLYRKIYDSLMDKVSNPAHLVLLVADYQYKSAFVADQEINLTACLVDVMANLDIK